MPEYQLNPDLFGWHDRPDDVAQAVATMPSPFFGAAAPNLEDTGKGKVVLLYQFVRKVFGRDIILTQKRGVCVSKGWSGLVDHLKATQIVLGAREQFVNTTASEPIYAGSRIEIGKGGCGYQDGSIGAWAAKFVVDYGTMVRGVYGQYDLTHEDDSIAVAWGAPGHGVPDTLEPTLHEHPIATTSLVTTYEEARDAIANGYPVAVCSDQGFTMTRDSEGFARPSGSWPHCMVFVGVDDSYKRPGLCCLNSWGPDWISGPKRNDQPEGSFWVDADTATRMLRGGDSFSGSHLTSYPVQRLDHMML